MARKSIYRKEYKKILSLLKAKRLERLISQENLAKKLGVPQSYISKIENGERRIDIVELKEICEILKVDFIGFVKCYLEEIKS